MGANSRGAGAVAVLAAPLGESMERSGRSRGRVDFACPCATLRPVANADPIPFRAPPLGGVQRPGPAQVHFDRRELGAILGLYGRMVAAGEWRDYGISALRDVAVFSVFRRTAEMPLYRIEKRPKLRARRQTYAVIGVGGHVLKRGDDLPAVLRVLERKLIRAVD